MNVIALLAKQSAARLLRNSDVRSRVAQLQAELSAGTWRSPARSNWYTGMARGGLLPIATMLERLGKKEEARHTLSLLLDLAGKYPVQPLIALVYVGLDERAEALAGLEKAYQQHSPMMIWLKVDPRLDRIRQEPGFQDLMRRVGLI